MGISRERTAAAHGRIVVAVDLDFEGLPVPAFGVFESLSPFLSPHDKE
jgi:hypothetical protein